MEILRKAYQAAERGISTVIISSDYTEVQIVNRLILLNLRPHADNYELAQFLHRKDVNYLRDLDNRSIPRNPAIYDAIEEIKSLPLRISEEKVRNKAAESVYILDNKCNKREYVREYGTE